MSMGNWKTKKLKRQMAGRSNSTKSKKARLYTAIPQDTGWPGGEPERNGYKRRAG